jgi:hypothetical protein
VKDRLPPRPSLGKISFILQCVDPRLTDMYVIFVFQAQTLFLKITINFKHIVLSKTFSIIEEIPFKTKPGFCEHCIFER